MVSEGHKTAADDEIRRSRPVWVDRHVVRVLLHLVGRGAALDAAEIEIGLVIEAPQLVGEELAVNV